MLAEAQDNQNGVLGKTQDNQHGQSEAAVQDKQNGVLEAK